MDHSKKLYAINVKILYCILTHLGQLNAGNAMKACQSYIGILKLNRSRDLHIT